MTRTGETVAGLALAAALAAAFCAVRARQAAPPEPAPPTTGATAVPDVTLADARIDVGDVRVDVAAGPRPLRAFAGSRFRFRATRDGAPVALGGASVEFTMAMPMGDHPHALVLAADGWQEAEAVLPVCPSGGRRWQGTLAFTLEDGRPRSARFAFDLQPPSPSPAGDRRP